MMRVKKRFVNLKNVFLRSSRFDPLKPLMNRAVLVRLAITFRAFMSDTAIRGTQKGMTQKPATKVRKRTAIETVQDEIKDRIFASTYAPGARLHVDNLRQEFGVSTATMREALSRLMNDELVTTERQRGFHVRPLSLEDFRNISHAREVIEVEALRESLKNRNDEWEGELFAAFHKLKLIEDRIIGSQEMDIAGEWQRRNSQFHDCLIANCQNDWLIRYRHQLHEHSSRYLRLALSSNRNHRDVRTEHLAIFESAIAGDVEKCATQLGRHISDSINDVAKFLENIVPLRSE